MGSGEEDLALLSGDGRLSADTPMEYHFENGARFQGLFMKGRFHGDGTLHYEGKGKLHGVWSKGKLLTGTFVFEDGLEYDTSDDWTYCTAKDRRYFEEIQQGIDPAGQSLPRTKKVASFEIPPKAFDVCDGYFDADRGAVFDYKTKSHTRIPQDVEVISDRAFQSKEK